MARSIYKSTCEVAWYTGTKPKAELHAHGAENTVIRKGKEKCFWNTPLQNIQNSMWTTN
jgi:hypothetical protein